jgi:hypothetical protein
MRCQARLWLATLLFVSILATANEPQPLVVAYFVPQDRQSIPGYQTRLERVMREVQRFYRDGMQTAGYGPLTFRLPTTDDGKLLVHLVQGKSQARDYGRGASDKVRDEVESGLRGQGIELNKRTLVIFQVLLDWKDGRASEVGPYVGGGSHLEGTAWVYDDALLNPGALGSKDPGGFYGRPCSIGQFNSHYVGGVAHELGHALGLPHVAGPKSESRHSLMGDGNHTYGEELRGEGAGSYLHPASAMLLARARPFAGEIADAERGAEAQIENLQATFAEGRILLEGRLTAVPQAFGVIAYNDFKAIPSDYDAQGWVAPVDDKGEFRLSVEVLSPGAYELRLQACHTNGATSTSVFDYSVDASGTPDLKSFSRSAMLFRRAIQAYAKGQRRRAGSLLQEMDSDSALPTDLLPKARHLRALLNPAPPIRLADLPAEQKRVSLSGAEFSRRTVGWGRPLVDQVLPENGSECFIRVGGRFYEHGIFAHAPAAYATELDGSWRQLSTSYGLQDGRAGSVMFVIRGDGKELWRSSRIADDRVRHAKVDVAGVHNLELITEDGEDGNSSDWAVWVAPELTR